MLALAGSAPMREVFRSLLTKSARSRTSLPMSSLNHQLTSGKEVTLYGWPEHLRSSIYQQAEQVVNVHRVVNLIHLSLRFLNN